MNREERILEYIKANPGCTKTKVYNCTDMGEGTAKTILKKLINDGKVICKIDDVNPRIHHLYIDEVEISRIRTKNFILSKVEGQMKNQICTTFELENGELVSIPVRTQFSTNYLPSAFEIMDKLVKKGRQTSDKVK